jgi:uncharacterized protein
MRIVFDSDKNAANIARRGIAFESAEEFDWSGALLGEDRRRAYPEPRYIAVGPLSGALHVLVFSLPAKNVLRVISLRRANARERRRFHAKT